MKKTTRKTNIKKPSIQKTPVQDDVIEKLSTIQKKKYKDEESLLKLMNKEVEAFTDEEIEDDVDVEVLEGGSSEDPELIVNPCNEAGERYGNWKEDLPQADDDIDEDDFLLQAKTSPVNDSTEYDFTLGVVVGMAIASIVFTIMFDFIY